MRKNTLFAAILTVLFMAVTLLTSAQAQSRGLKPEEEKPTGKCGEGSRAMGQKCLTLEEFEDGDKIVSAYDLPTATVYFSASAQAVMGTLSDQGALENWTSYLRLPKARFNGRIGSRLPFEDSTGKQQVVYVTGNRKKTSLEFTVIESGGPGNMPKTLHYVLVDGGTDFHEVKLKAKK